MRMIDASVPVYYAPDIGPIELVGDGADVRIPFCEQRKFAGEFVLMPVVEIIRPVSSCMQLTLRDMLCAMLGDRRQIVPPH